MFGIEELLRLAFEKKASDLHLSVGSAPMLRLSGKLVPLGDDRLTPDVLHDMVNTLMTPSQQSAYRSKGELDFSYGIAGLSRYRLNVYKQRGTDSIAARIIPSHIPDIHELNMPEAVLNFAERPQGLLLVTGPTGSGKSTTLAAIIDHINSRYARHIITLEDPIEYLHRHQKSLIDQREVGLDTQSFTNGLRAALRQDPDVILVGEMRDLETIHTAITAAETGHLVLATLHTMDAANTINRIIDVFPPFQQAQVRLQLASVLLGIVSQRLLPLKSGEGRISAVEVLSNTPAIGNLIRSDKVHQIKSLMQTGRSHGMQTMESSLQQLVGSGKISDETARSQSLDWDQM